MSRSDILLESIKNFYLDEKNSGYLVDILEHRKGISLRNLEWFITDYSKNEALGLKVNALNRMQTWKALLKTRTLM
jgi:hypothetical protein